MLVNGSLKSSSPKTADAPRVVKRPAKTRSRVTNGRSLFADVKVDERGAWARRFVDLVELHSEDLGGADRLSEAQRSLVRRVASLEVELERLEGAMAVGESIDLDAYGRAANTVRRLLETLGIERKAKTVEVTLADIMSRHTVKKAGDDA